MLSKDRVDGLIAILKTVRNFIRTNPKLAEELLDDLIESYNDNSDIIISILDKTIFTKKPDTRNKLFK